MTMMNAASSWNVGRVGAVCAGCGAALTPHAVSWAALCDQPAVANPAAGSSAPDGKAAPPPFARLDYCESCWAQGRRPDAPLEMFSFWKTTVPAPQEKKKLLVDDSVLMDVFGRMEGRDEPREVRFRFVLALILMRKRLLKYEGMEEKGNGKTRMTNDESAGGAAGPAPEVWRMLPKGSEAPVQVVNPHLTAEQITEVSQQLSAILAEEI